MGKTGCKSSAETGHCLGQICFSRTFVMVNWNSWRTGGYEWLMWQKRPAGLGWNFRNEKDKCLIKVCVCVYFLSCWCSLCLCLHAWNQYIHLLWMFLSHCDRLLRDHVGLPCHLERCVETLPQDPYSAKVAAANPSADSHKLRPWNITFAQTQQ